MKEAKEAKARRHSGERRKPTRVRLSDYAAEWVDAYQGAQAEDSASPPGPCTSATWTT
jgi:hypothetical protein